MHRATPPIVNEIPRLKNLTHLGGLPRAVESLAPKGSRLINAASLLPRLKYLEVIIGYQPTWAVVGRNWRGKLQLDSPIRSIDNSVQPRYWPFAVLEQS